MSLLIQEMVFSEQSFVIHSQNPFNQSSLGPNTQVYMELAVGLGETLASASQKGTPYRVVYDWAAESCKIIAFSSFSHALFA